MAYLADMGLPYTTRTSIGKLPVKFADQTGSIRFNTIFENKPALAVFYINPKIVRIEILSGQTILQRYEEIRRKRLIKYFRKITKVIPTDRGSFTIYRDEAYTRFVFTPAQDSPSSTTQVFKLDNHSMEQLHKALYKVSST